MVRVLSNAAGSTYGSRKVNSSNRMSSAYQIPCLQFTGGRPRVQRTTREGDAPLQHPPSRTTVRLQFLMSVQTEQHPHHAYRTRRPVDAMSLLRVPRASQLLRVAEKGADVLLRHSSVFGTSRGNMLNASVAVTTMSSLRFTTNTV